MHRLLRDPYVLLPLAVAALTLLAYQWPGVGHPAAVLWAGHLADPSFLVLTVITLVASRRPTAHVEERRFWALVFATSVFWLAGQVALIVGSVLASHKAAGWLSDLLNLCSYATWILSADTRPHLPSGWTRRNSAFRFAVAASLFCVAGLVAYFFVIPSLHPRGAAAGSAADVTFLALDALLVVRFGHLFVTASGSSWRPVYGALAVSLAASCVSDGMNLLLAFGRMKADYGTPLDALWWMPFLALIAARRLRTQQIDRGAATAPAATDDPRTDATELLFFYALAFPAAHLVLGALGLRTAQDDAARDLLVLAGLLGFVGLAVAQQRRTERRNRELRSKLRVLVTNDQVVQSQKLEAVGRLAGGLAHDFNNLLTVVLARAELLVSSLAWHPGRHDAEEIRDAARRGADLTQQLLAFSRSQVLRATAVDLNAAVSQAMTVMRRLAGEPYTLRCELEPGLGAIDADPTQLLQVFFNLVTNARDAMPSGGTITIRTRRSEVTDADGDVVPPTVRGELAALEVADAGVGIDPDQRKRVFEPFFTTKVGGTGLGLAVVYGIVAQGGGCLRVRSQRGRGSTFTAYFPFSTRPAPAAPPPEPPSRTESGSRRTVLLVEDQRPVREAVRLMLEALECRVLAAGSGAEALEICRRTRHELDLLLTDVVMPGMRGPELATRVLALRPGIAILFMSGFVEEAFDSEQAGGIEAGFLAKPVTLESLRQKIEELLPVEVA